MSGLRSGQVADAAGVNRQTLRYYERRGLLPEPERSLGGHRLYPAETVTVLKVIKAAQRLGFTLDEVADLLASGGHRHGRPDAGLRERATAKLAEVEAKIADLQVIAATLRAAVAAGCDDLVVCAAQQCCPIPFATIPTGAPDAGPR
ncbi:MerR family transcriptional regulator [Actinoplanes sp. NPDC049596]|uniref:MerR family transcriptional regulator n=1 Tax=unclassified Actinoplanes TaxID=2626549 RepID=UPI00342FCFCD